MQTVNRSGLTPLEFYVVVELPPVEEKTAGGIILTRMTQDADRLAGQEGTLVAVSPHAFTYADNWPEGSIPTVGQKVLFKKFDGTGYEREIDGVKREFKLLNDKSIIAVIDDEPALAAVA